MKKAITIGPITKDTIIKGRKVFRSIGGSVYYHACTLSSLGIDTTAVITIAKEDRELLKAFPKDVKLFPVFVKHTVEFENIYLTSNLNYRIQKARILENPIKVKDIYPMNFKEADVILLGPLFPTDIPSETIEYLFKFKIPIYLSAQGYLRHLEDHKIALKPWEDAQKFLKFVRILFLDENEARVILNTKFRKLEEVAKILASYGPEEVVITCGDEGSIIYSKKADEFYKIPAFAPKIIGDPTGLGDTYMAAYAARKLETSDPKESGIFASAAATLKFEGKGTFRASRRSVMMRIQKASHL